MDKRNFAAIAGGNWKGGEVTSKQIKEIKRAVKKLEGKKSKSLIKWERQRISIFNLAVPGGIGDGWWLNLEISRNDKKRMTRAKIERWKRWLVRHHLSLMFEAVGPNGKIRI